MLPALGEVFVVVGPGQGEDAKSRIQPEPCQCDKHFQGRGDENKLRPKYDRTPLKISASN